MPEPNISLWLFVGSAMVRVLWLLALVACETPAPTCEETIANTVLWYEDSGPLDMVGQPRMERLIPFSGRLTSEDAKYLIDECRGWSPRYRRCIHGARSTAAIVTCNQHEDEAGLAWIVLPSRKAWLEALGELSQEAYGKAYEAQLASDAKVGELRRALSELPQDARNRGALEAELAAAERQAAQAKALVEACGAHPLEKPACLALIGR